MMGNAQVSHKNLIENHDDIQELPSISGKQLADVSINASFNRKCDEVVDNDRHQQEVDKRYSKSSLLETMVETRAKRFSKRAKTIQESADERRLQFQSTSGSAVMRSFDGHGHIDTEVILKPLKDHARSHSPLKQIRTYSFRSATSSEEDVLIEVQQLAIRLSWHQLTATLDEKNNLFGHLVFKRVFQKAPTLIRALNVQDFEKIENIELNESLRRYWKLFAEIVDLTVRNVDSIETEIAPTIFTYGRRLYNMPEYREYMTEQNVRLICSEVVSTIFDLLRDDADSTCMDSWITLMRYLGNKLLEGFQFEHLNTTKRLSIRTNDHKIFLF